MPRIYFVVGPPGAGKTTYARKLAESRNGIVLSIDEWMQTLFAADRAGAPDFRWMIERVQRAEAQMWSVAQQIVQRRVPVVFDCGLLTAAHRADFRLKAAAAGAPTSLHYLRTPVDVRWQRVRERNHERGATYSFEVTRPMFDFIEGLWEEPAGQELALPETLIVEHSQIGI
jgi:predicted kinase